MTEFWEKSFIQHQEMWGMNASQSTILASQFFQKQGYKSVLVPGCGYGRNAQVFVEAGFGVTGIEISQTAIDLARKAGFTWPIYHGSVAEMPFDSKQYEGVFSYALLHLLDSNVRAKFIESCYQQLAPGGTMIFTSISKEAPMYGKGTKISENEHESPNGIRLFFYDEAMIQAEFSDYGLIESHKIEERDSDNPNKAAISFWWIRCQKPIE